MCQDLKNGVLAGEVIEGTLACDSEHDQAGLAFGRRGQNLNQAVAVDDARFNVDGPGGRGIAAEAVKLFHGLRIEGDALALAPHFLDVWQDMEEDQTASSPGGHLAGKHCARAGGLSESGGMQDDGWSISCFLLKMGLWTHGNDRDIDRAQYLFSHGTQLQRALLAQVPGTNQNSVRHKQSYNIGDLLGGIAFAKYCRALQMAPRGGLAPWFEGSLRKPDRLFRVVGGLARGVVQCSGVGCKHMEKNQMRAAFGSLLERVGHEPVKVAKVGRDQNDCGIGPSSEHGFRHGQASSEHPQCARNVVLIVLNAGKSYRGTATGQ